MEKSLIGRIDVADLPAFDLHEIPVKIDTGAYTCSIHCDAVEEVDGVLEVRFFEWKGKASPVFRFDAFEMKSVKSSNGQQDDRYIINGNIRLFGKDIEAKFSLSTRQEMKFPVLLGRRLLNDHFIVDTSKSNLSWKKGNKGA